VSAGRLFPLLIASIVLVPIAVIFSSFLTPADEV